MTLFANRDLNRLAVHSTLEQLSWGISSAFSAVYLLREGLSTAAIFLCLGAIIVLRFAFRPAVLACVRAIGLRRTLIIGTFLYGLQSLALAPVHGLDPALLLYCGVTALAQAFYWTCYHAMFAAVGDSGTRGLAVRMAPDAGRSGRDPGPGSRRRAVGLLRPVGGFRRGRRDRARRDRAAHRRDRASDFALGAPDAFPLYRRGVLLLGTDGWIFNTATWAWSLFMFQALDARYDVFGGALAAAALAGAVSGLVLGRCIDLGHARRATWANAVALAGTLIAQALCGAQPVAVFAVAIGGTMLGGLYIPSLMTAIYNEAEASPCPLRFHFTAEVGWDLGGALACLVAAAACAGGLPLQIVILLALPMVAIQASILDASYASAGRTRVAGPLGA